MPFATPVDVTIAERILTVAEPLVFEFGYSRFTMDQLADALGMSKKTLYKHYGSKEELVSQVLDARAARLERELAALLECQDADFRRKMKAFVEYVIARFAEISEPFLHDLRRTAPKLFRKIDSFRESAIPRHLRVLLEEGVSAGVFRGDFPLDVVAAILIHAIQDMLLPRRNEETLAMAPAKLIDVVIRIICEGIVVRSSPPRKKRG